MKQRAIHRAAVVGAFAGMLFILTQAQSDAQNVQIFTSLTTWQAAVGNSSQFVATFQDITTPAYFQTATASFGPFSFQQIGQDKTFGFFENFIDVPPLQFTDNSGVTTAALYTKSGVETVSTNFAKPLYAWGANFYGAQTGELENMVLTAQGGAVIATVPITIDTGFFGVVVTSRQGLSSITFESRLTYPDPTVGQGFGLENITGAFISALKTVSPSQVTVNASGLSYSRVTQIFSGTITIKNVSQSTITGPFIMTLPSLPSGASLAGAAGTYNGNPYLNISATNLLPGQSAILSVQFNNPTNAPIMMAPVVYSEGS